ncbi:hypothetical protein LINPERHAP2_LOCUS22759 [Linum perenne]
MAKLQFGHSNSVVSTIWPRSYESPLTPFSIRFKLQNRFPSQPTRFIVLQEFPEQATDHRSFLRRVGAVDHETV